MPEKKQTVYPYMPNTTPAVRQEMLDAIGRSNVAELFQAAIPDEVRYGDNNMLPLPPAITNERELRRYVTGMLKKNTSCDDYISFLGGGVAHHFVPAICDELVRKPEWLTTFMGAACDTGKVQMWWEFQSLICDLVEREMCGWPAQDGTTSAWSAILTAGRVNKGRTEAVVAGNIDPQRLTAIKDVCRAKLDIKVVAVDKATGLLDMEDYKSKVSDKTACVYFENPAYLGGIEPRGQEIADAAHANGALVVVAVNPLSLGLMETPSNYGADVICGELQSLGVHLQYGGGMIGFVATPFDDNWAPEYPYLVMSRVPSSVPDEASFASANMDTVSYDKREEAGDITSTNSALWCVPVCAYLSVMGPEGLREVGEAIISKANYAKKQLATVNGVSFPTDASTPFMEFVVNFDKTGKTVEQINKALLGKEIFGGHDLSQEFPQYGQSALYCVTENISKADIDTLVSALKEVV